MFRRSGGFTAYFVDGKVPEPGSPAFLDALSGNRFRSIESAASEEHSLGWVSPGDPTGDSFEAEDIDVDGALWLRVRMDKKKLPPIWVTIHRTEAERSRGKPMSARERKELRVDLEQRLLPRILPSVQLVDVLWDPKHQTVLLFTTSQSVREEFQKLFVRTFAAMLTEADPRELAKATGIDRDALAYLEEVAPVRWPRQGEGKPVAMTRRDVAPEDADVDDVEEVAQA